MSASNSPQKPLQIYRLGNKLRIDLHQQPELTFHVVVGDTHAAILNPGQLYDFIRIMTMFTARQRSFLLSAQGKPVHLVGERTKEKCYVNDASFQSKAQLDLFREEEEEEAETEAKSNDSALKDYLERRLVELKLGLRAGATRELLEEIESLRMFLKELGED